MTDKPLTAIAVVKDKRKCPQKFDCQTLASDGSDANIWKSGWLAKSTRYICTSTDPSNSSYGEVITNMQLISGSEHVPSGFEVLATTTDSREPILDSNKRIIYKRLPLSSTSNVVTDVMLFARAKSSPNYSILGVLNGMQLVVKTMSTKSIKGDLSTSSTSPTPLSRKPYSSGSNHEPSPLAHRNTINPTLRQGMSRGTSLTTSTHTFKSMKLTPRIVSPIEGIEFKLSRFVQALSSTPQNMASTASDMWYCTHKINEIRSYNFTTEQSFLNSVQ